ncbi:hypothetical protein Tco_1342691 [Tanacetum coccineum]
MLGSIKSVIKEECEWFSYVCGWFDIDEFSVHKLNDVMEELGYVNDDPIYYHYMIPGTDLDIGLRALGNDMDVKGLARLTRVNKNSSKRLLLEYSKPSPTQIVTPTPIVNPNLTITPTPIVNPTPTVTPTHNVTPTPNPTPTVTPIPNLTPTPTHTPTATLYPSKRKFTKNSINRRKTIVTELDSMNATEPETMPAFVNTSDPETLSANVNASEPENVVAFVNTSELETLPANVNASEPKTVAFIVVELFSMNYKFDPLEDNVTVSMNEQPSVNE